MNINAEYPLISGNRTINTYMNYKTILPIVIGTALMFEVAHFPSEQHPHLPEVEYMMSFNNYCIPSLSGVNINTHSGLQAIVPVPIALEIDPPTPS